MGQGRDRRKKQGQEPALDWWCKHRGQDSNDGIKNEKERAHSVVLGFADAGEIPFFDHGRTISDILCRTERAVAAWKGHGNTREGCVLTRIVPLQIDRPLVPGLRVLPHAGEHADGFRLVAPTAVDADSCPCLLLAYGVLLR